MPRISTRKRQHTHDLCHCPKPKCAKMKSMADTIVANAIRIGLSVRTDSRNCFLSFSVTAVGTSRNNACYNNIKELRGTVSVYALTSGTG